MHPSPTPPLRLWLGVPVLLLALAGCGSSEGALGDDRPKITSESALVDLLVQRGYLVRQTGFGTERIEGVRSDDYEVEGRRREFLRMWAFETEAQAERAAREVRFLGRSSASALQRGVYQSGTLVVEYVGSDPSVRAEFRAALGPPS